MTIGRYVLENASSNVKESTGASSGHVNCDMSIKLVVFTSISTTGSDTLHVSACDVYASSVGTM